MYKRQALVFQTLFGPLKTAVQNYGYDLVMAHCKEAPDAVARAVMRIAEAQTEWAMGFIDAGADGLFYSCLLYTSRSNTACPSARTIWAP